MGFELSPQPSRQPLEQRLAMGADWPDEGLVFVQADGSPVDPERVGKVFEWRVAKSGLPRIRFHDSGTAMRST